MVLLAISSAVIALMPELYSDENVRANRAVATVRFCLPTTGSLSLIRSICSLTAGTRDRNIHSKTTAMTATMSCSQ